MANPIKVLNNIIKAEEDFADFIQNGPADGIGGYARDQYRKRCEQFSNLPSWARALSRGPAGSLGRVCKPYLDDIGADLPEVAPPPFTGGQCAGKPYRYQYAVVQANGSQGAFTVVPCSANRFGPISTRSQTVGQITTLFISSADINGVITEGSVATSNSQITLNLQIISTCNGTADDCGDPDSPGLEPGPNPAPNPGPTPGPEPTDDPNSPIPFLPIPPYNDPIGGPTPIEPPPDPTGGGGNPPNAPGGDGQPGDPDAVGDDAGGTEGGGDGDDVDFGPPPDGRVWVGALVESTVDTRLGNIPGTGPQNTVYPAAIANVSLRFSTGRSSSFMIKSKWFSLFRPSTALVLEGAFIQAQPGVSCRIRPVSAPTCPENPCEDNDNG